MIKLSTDQVQAFINGKFYDAFGIQANHTRAFSFPNQFSETVLKDVVIDGNKISATIQDMHKIKKDAEILVALHWAFHHPDELHDAFHFHVESFTPPHEIDARITLEMIAPLEAVIDGGAIKLSYVYKVPYQDILTAQNGEIYDENALKHAAIGFPSVGFGEKNAQYDDFAFFIPRSPAGQFLCMSSIKPLDEKQCVATYIPQEKVDFAHLLEAALQPCGWLAQYGGCALEFKQPIPFRNLNGALKLYGQFENLDQIRFDVTMREKSKFGQTMILHFDVDGYHGSDKILELNTSFGYFSQKSLEKQQGLPSTHTPFNLKDYKPKVVTKSCMVDDILECTKEHIIGRYIVNPDDWYFKVHFFQDPVMPGSIGMQAFYDLIELYCAHEINNGKKLYPTGLCEWKYRGQVLMHHGVVQYRVNILSIEEDLIKAEAWLYVDDKCIYHAPVLEMRFY